MTTESPTYIATTQLKTEAPAKVNTHAFLGLYITKDLKDIIAKQAKQDDCSMSKFASRVFKKHFGML